MIFLTGGTGLLGLHILDELRRQGHEVTAMARDDRAAARLAARGASPRAGDVAEPAAWNNLDGHAAIVHSAAIIAGGASWDEYERVNVGGTRFAVEAALRLGVPLVHISSVAVYGPAAGRQPAGSVAEDFPTGSRTAGQFYARSKRLAEDVVWGGVARGLRAVVLRPCVVYGEGDRLFLPNLVRWARRGVFPLVGSGRAPLPLVEARNVATAVSAALRAPDGWGRAYNVANDDEVSGEELVRGIAEGLGRPVRAVRFPGAFAMGLAGILDLVRGPAGGSSPGFRAGVRFLQGGNPFTSQAARQGLEWRPPHRHREALPRAVRALQKA